MEKTFDINAELERINKDIDDMEEAGMEQVSLSFFGGNSQEKQLLISAIALIKSRGYVHELDYEDGEIWLTIKKGEGSDA